MCISESVVAPAGADTQRLYPMHLVIGADGYLYWTAQDNYNGATGDAGALHGQVLRVPKGASSAAPEIVARSAAPNSIAFDGATVYWYDDVLRKVLAAPAACGGTCDPAAVSDGTALDPPVDLIAIGPGLLLAASQGSGAILFTSDGVSKAFTPTTLTPNLSGGSAAASSDGTIFLVSSGSLFEVADGGLQGLATLSPEAGTTEITLVAATCTVVRAVSVAQGDASAWSWPAWLQSYDVDAGGLLTPVSFRLPREHYGLAGDNEFLYVGVPNGNGGVWAFRWANGAITQVVSDLGTWHTVAVDDDYVYFAQHDKSATTGAVYRVHK
jgi:hypothetical protein